MRVVGIGASAGGMEALITLLSHLPDNTGAAFVLILHLSPDHQSFMDQLLGKHTGMPISVVERYTRVEANHIYLISKDYNLTFEKGMLLTHPRPSDKGLNLPVDLFFHSLGKSQGEQAIGLILSGSGTDGSRGVRTIREAGGLVLVQSPESAKFDGMPQTIIRLQLANRVLPPAAMADMLANILSLQTYPDGTSVPSLFAHQDVASYLQRILRQVLAVTGTDFSGYRESTLLRRLANRILLYQLDDPEQYFQLLRTDEQEVTARHRDFLIGVTRFFRDPEAFDILEENILPAIFSGKTPHEVVRIWVPACSSGEEAYSLAVIIARYLERHKLPFDFKIFGTDIDQWAIKLASEGVFPYNCSADIPPDLLAQYFIKEGDFYRIKAAIRDKMLFAVHNLLSQPPFIHMDLISCRNTLIYFKPPVQRAVLSTFHFALKPQGFLFLGPSESLGEVKHAYAPLHKKWNIFQKKENTHLGYASRIRSRQAPAPRMASGNSPLASRAVRQPPSSPDGQEDPFSRFLMDRYLPTLLLVSPELEVIYLHGKVDDLLPFPKAGQGVNLRQMLDEALLTVFEHGVQEALRADEPVQHLGVRFYEHGRQRDTDFRFSKFEHPARAGTSVMVEVHFKADVPAADAGIRQEEVSSKKPVQDHVQALEEELERVRQSREKLISQLKATNEELQTSNRELMTANEELQRTNEELQSVNEELYTVNNELQLKNENLTTVNNDINNLLKSTDIGTIFLDRELCIRRFTPAVRRQFNLLETDIGRPITHFSSTLQQVDIARICRQVYDSLETFEQQVIDQQGNHYLLRILPYRTEKDVIKGLVINFVDVNELMGIKEQIEAFANKFQAIFQFSNEIIIVVENDGLIRRINQAFAGQPPEALLGHDLFAFLPGPEGEKVRSAVARTYREAQTQELELAVELHHGEQKFYEGCIIPVKDPSAANDPVLSIMLIWRDVTETVLAGRQMETAVREYESFMDHAWHQIVLVDEAGIVKHLNFIRYADVDRKDIIGNSIFQYLTEVQAEQMKKAIKQVFAGGPAEKIEYDYTRPDGQVVRIELIGTPVIIKEVIKYAALIVTEREP